MRRIRSGDDLYSVGKLHTCVALAIASEKRLFESRRQARDGQRAQLRERIAQIKEESRTFQLPRVEPFRMEPKGDPMQLEETIAERVLQETDRIAL